MAENHMQIDIIAIGGRIPSFMLEQVFEAPYERASEEAFLDLVSRTNRSVQMITGEEQAIQSSVAQQFSASGRIILGNARQQELMKTVGWIVAARDGQGNAIKQRIYSNGKKVIIVPLQQEDDSIVIDDLLAQSELLTEENDILQQNIHEKSFDPLTGALSRGAILEKMTKLGNSHRQSDQANIGVLLFDIDHFKQVNDTYGHDAGDAVLKEFSARVSSALRSTNDNGGDLFARIGGEEFLVILDNNIPKDEVNKIAEKIRIKIEAKPFIYKGRNIPVTTSIGAIWCDKADLKEALSLPADCGENKTGVLPVIANRADTALYIAKNTGRNRVLFSGFQESKLLPSKHEKPSGREDVWNPAQGGSQSKPGLG